MEKCGQNLYDYMRERNFDIAEQDSIDIMKGILDGFKVLLAADVVHRDIKPHNILFSFGTNIPKIADFGWSKVINDGVNVLHTYAGTPAYMSPEILKGMVDYK